MLQHRNRRTEPNTVVQRESISSMQGPSVLACSVVPAMVVDDLQSIVYCRLEEPESTSVQRARPQQQCLRTG